MTNLRGRNSFDCDTREKSRIILKITAKVINLFNAPMRLAA